MKCYQEIPFFPEFRPLRLDDRPRLQPHFRRLQPEISDRCFTNLFVWRDFYDIQVSRFKDNICLFCASSSTPEKEFFFPPLGQSDMLENLDACFDFMASRDIQPFIRRASEDFVRTYLNGQSRYVATEGQDISDYVYLAEDMIKLRGRRYHGQRNYIKRFFQSYPRYSTEFIAEDNLQECVQLNREWLESKLQLLSQRLDICSEAMPDEVVFLKAEAETAEYILLNFAELELTGLAVRIDGVIRAFTVGEKLNDRMALIHIEKVDHSYLGLGQFLSQTFCEQAWTDCDYINRMEDLGIEGLRKAKLALGPHHMARKYSITLQEPVRETV